MQPSHAGGPCHGIFRRPSPSIDHRRAAGLDEGKKHRSYLDRDDYPGSAALYLEIYLGPHPGPFYTTIFRATKGMANNRATGAGSCYSSVGIFRSGRACDPDGCSRCSGGIFQRQPGYRHRCLSPRRSAGRRTGTWLVDVHLWLPDGYAAGRRRRLDNGGSYALFNGIPDHGRLHAAGNSYHAADTGTPGRRRHTTDHERCGDQSPGRVFQPQQCRVDFNLHSAL